MKVIYNSLLTLLLFCIYTLADAQILASWDFENPPTMNPSTAPTSVSAGIMAANVTVSGATNAAVTHPGTNGSAPDPTFYAFSSDGWPTRPVSGTGTLDPGKYYEYTITAQASCSLNVQGIQNNHRAVDVESAPNPAYYELRTSYDGFTTSINRGAFGPVTPADGNYNAGTFTATNNPSPPSPFGVAGLSTLTFRYYFYNLPDAMSVIEMDKVRIVGRVTCPAVLPVELTTFQGKAVGNQVQLSWETAWETNADRFEVERSSNATEFGALGQVKAAGDVTQKQAYGFTDAQPLTGANYYRLRQVDRNGRVEYSKIIAVTTTPDAPGILVLGNPTEGGRINLQLFNLEASTLRLTDIGGHSIPFRVTESIGGKVTLEATGSLSSGVYVIGAAKATSVKVVVQ